MRYELVDRRRRGSDMMILCIIYVVIYIYIICILASTNRVCIPEYDSYYA